MSKGTLFDKIWESHKVATLDSGKDQLFIGLHLVHEVTSPQAFQALRERGSKVAFPNRTFSTIDHIVPTNSLLRPYKDPVAEEMVSFWEKNMDEFKINYFHVGSGKQGIVHVIGPELGLTQPGMTIACGDSHTSTHGAFGSLAFGIGTTEVEYVLETQTLALDPLKVRRIDFDGVLEKGVYAKDVVLKIIESLGVQGGVGYAYEYGGEILDNMTMEERMTVCNMSIEGGARIGYVNPDQTTADYLKGREYVREGEDLERLELYWQSVRSDKNAKYDDHVSFSGADLEPMVTWGINPGQATGISGKLPTLSDLPDAEREITEKAYAHMGFTEKQEIAGTNIDVAFIGSCTNGRYSDIKIVAEILEGQKVDSNTQLIVVPGSEQVKAQVEADGLHKIIEAAGGEWRSAGCSMCLAMNPDKLTAGQRSISSTNRNFIGRQGDQRSMTMLASPATVAASAIQGYLVDAREYIGDK